MAPNQASLLFFFHIAFSSRFPLARPCGADDPKGWRMLFPWSYCFPTQFKAHSSPHTQLCRCASPQAALEGVAVICFNHLTAPSLFMGKPGLEPAECYSEGYVSVCPILLEGLVEFLRSSWLQKAAFQAHFSCNPIPS